MTSLCVHYRFEHTKAAPCRVGPLFLHATCTVALFSTMLYLQGIASFRQMSFFHSPQSLCTHFLCEWPPSLFVLSFFLFSPALRKEVHISWTAAGAAYWDLLTQFTYGIVLPLSTLKVLFWCFLLSSGSPFSFLLLPLQLNPRALYTAVSFFFPSFPSSSSTLLSRCHSRSSARV